MNRLQGGNNNSALQLEISHYLVTDYFPITEHSQVFIPYLMYKNSTDSPYLSLDHGVILLIVDSSFNYMIICFCF